MNDPLRPARRLTSSNDAAASPCRHPAAYLGGRWGRGTLALSLILSTLLSAGCATVEKDRRANALRAATNAHQAAIRWGNFDAAWGAQHPDLRQTPSPASNLFDGLRVTGYDELQSPVMPDDATATQTVLIDYLREDTQVVKRLIDRQVWRWDPERKSWWLHSGLPAFK